MTQPQNNTTPEPNKIPGKSDEGTHAQPKPSTEVDPSIPGNNTEVGLDKNKISTYPGIKPPERH